MGKLAFNGMLCNETVAIHYSLHIYHCQSYAHFYIMQVNMGKVSAQV